MPSESFARGVPDEQGESGAPLDRRYSSCKEASWTLQRYAHLPLQGSDKWDEALWASDGWIIRSHGRLRKQAFDPIHQRVKVDVKQLTRQRTTILFDSRSRQVIQDERMSSKSSPWPHVHTCIMHLLHNIVMHLRNSDLTVFLVWCA